jgi:ethanolamine utilization protein EutA
MDQTTITSVGIDIGTSTTKMIVSRLKLAKTSGSFAVPRIDIVDREVTYESPIISTPLLNKEEINGEVLAKWLEDQYAAARLTLQQIKSGAVIITGETAVKKNAQTVLHYLADRSGDFVVAVAGASLEGILAGKGSGAYSRLVRTRQKSQLSGKIVCEAFKAIAGSLG